MAKFLFIGLLFVSTSSIYTMEKILSFVGDKIDENQRGNADRIKAQEDALPKEEQQLNDLLVDPKTPTEVRAEFLRQREANIHAFQEAREEAARDAENQDTCLVQ